MSDETESYDLVARLASHPLWTWRPRGVEDELGWHEMAGGAALTLALARALARVWGLR